MIRLFMLALLACAGWAPLAHANPAQCGFVKDPDRQAYCRAVNGGGAGQCGFIRERDLQARCRAEVDRNPAQCGFIRDRDMQAACRAKVRN